MSSFYKMDPAAWDFGTAELSLEEEAAYLRLVNAMHKHDGPVPNVDRVLSGLFRVSTRKARSLVKALEKSGKVVIEEGKIWNERARSDLVQRGFASVSASERGAKGGRMSAELRSKALKDNKRPQAVASTRIEKNREEDKSSSKAAENYQKYLDAHPLPVNSPDGEMAFDAIVASGVDPAQIIAAAAAYAERAKTFSSPNFVQRSDNFLDPERGKWRHNIPPSAKPKPSDAEVLGFYAKVVLERQRSAPVTVNAAMAKRLVAANLVTTENLSDAGIAI